MRETSRSADCPGDAVGPVREVARRITARDGVSLAYWHWRGERRRDRVLLLLHGAASNHTRWSEFVHETRLTESWDVLCPDLRGNGRSMARGRLDLAVWCRDLEDVLDDAGYDAAVLVGHSLGAQIALHFAARSPGHAVGLALIDPLVPDALRGRRAVLARLRPLVALAARLARGLNALGLRRRSFPDRDLWELDEETRRALAEGAPPEELARRYSALGLILSHMPTANYLQQLLATVAPLPPLEALDLPVLVLRSAGISFADPEANSRELARLPRASLRSIEADHWPLTERPGEVRRALEEWLEGVDPRVPAADDNAP